MKTISRATLLFGAAALSIASCETSPGPSGAEPARDGAHDVAEPNDLDGASATDAPLGNSPETSYQHVGPPSIDDLAEAFLCCKWRCPGLSDGFGGVRDLPLYDTAVRTLDAADYIAELAAQGCIDLTQDLGWPHREPEECAVFDLASIPGLPTSPTSDRIRDGAVIVPDADWRPTSGGMDNCCHLIADVATCDAFVECAERTKFWEDLQALPAPLPTSCPGFPPVCPDLSGQWTIVQHCEQPSRVGEVVTFSQTECTVTDETYSYQVMLVVIGTGTATIVTPSDTSPEERVSGSPLAGTSNDVATESAIEGDESCGVKLRRVAAPSADAGAPDAAGPVDASVTD